MTRPGHLVILYVFIIFTVISAKIILTVTPVSRIPGAKTAGAAL